MSAYLLFKLSTCAVSLTLGTIVSARSAGLLVNRFFGVILLCGAYWSFCELMVAGQSDPDAAAVWIRLSVLGWMWIGPVSFQVFLELLGDRAAPLRRIVPFLYGSGLVGVLLYAATPWAVAGAEPSPWGFSPVHGPAFLLAYAPAISPLVIALLCFRQAESSFGSQDERLRSSRVHAASAVGVGLAVATDCVLPLLGLRVPSLSSFAIAVLGVLFTFNLNRYGYLILSPAAFAHQILESLEDGVALLRTDGSLLSANRSLEAMASAEPGALRSCRATELLPELKRRGANEVFSHSTHLLVSGDRSIPVSVTSLALRNSRGFMLGEALIVRDLREVVELRRRLVTAGRLAALGELSTAISQEISRPVARVLRNLEALRLEWDRVTADVHGPALAGLEKVVCEGEEIIDECIEGVERVDDVVREVRNFSRFESGERELSDANQLVDDALRTASPSVPAKVVVERDLAATQEIFCDPQKLERVVLDLLLSSIHGLEGEGRLRLSTEDGDGCVRIRIEDDGFGISAADRERIFDPFFTTKPVGDGTGLGLSVSYHIVRSHGGDIEVESQPGRTRFTIELPIADH